MTPKQEITCKDGGLKYCDCAREAMARGANRDWVDETEDSCPFRNVTPKQDSAHTEGNKPLTLQEAKEQAAKESYPSWHEFYNWVARTGEAPAVVAQQIESFCGRAAELYKESALRNPLPTEGQTSDNGRIEKLQAFKDYVHKRLDDAGIEVDPESEHKEKGCRIGGRLDIVLKRFEVSEGQSETQEELWLEARTFMKVVNNNGTNSISMTSEELLARYILTRKKP